MITLPLLISLVAPSWGAHTYDLRPIGPAKVTLQNGLWERGDPVEERVSLRKTLSADLNGDKKPEAILLFEYWGGGREKHDFVAVYTEDAKKKRWGRTALLDGGSAKDGTLDGIALAGKHVDVGHDAVDERYGAWVVVRRYRLLTGALDPVGVVDFRAREPAKPGPELNAAKKKARTLLTKDPAAGAEAYLAIHAALNTPASLGDAAFALMKAKHPLAKAALEAAAFRAKDSKQKGAAYYNLARYHLDLKQEEAALKAVRASLKHRPGNAPTQKLLTLLQAGLGVRAIDWGNRTYPIDEGAKRTLVNGTYEGTVEGDFGESLDLVNVSYGDVMGDDQEEALVHLNYWGGGTGRFDELLVFDARGKQIATLPGGDRADGGIAGATITKDGDVRLDRMYSGIEGGACCPVFVVKEVWRWEKGAFVEDPNQATLGTFADATIDDAKVPAIVKAADADARAGNTSAAAAALEEVLDTVKHRAMVYPLYGYLLMKDSHWGAVPVLRASLQFARTEKSEAATWYNIGRAHAQNMRWDAKSQPLAIKAFEKSLELRPGNKATEDALAAAKAWKKAK